MKKLLIMLFVFILCFINFFFVGCMGINDKEQRVYEVSEGVTLVCVGSAESYSIWVHEETGVMYIRYYEPQQEVGGISIMLDENGKPLLWQGE